MGVRSSRQIQRRCHEDLAFRVLVGNQLPDHVTIARFRVRHQQALAGFLVQSLKLCAAAGLVRLGLVALDGTKVAANTKGKPRKDGKPSASRSDGLRAAMQAKLTSGDGKVCYAMRQQTIEPVFGQLKEQQGARQFLRQGLAACDSEWKLLCGTHNLLKLWRHQATPPATSPATT
jgi:hypothetical protein